MPARVPAATYRLQFNAGFRLADAEHIVGYLRDLGISDLYASPLWTARSGSSHGYDVIDPSALNPELGAEDDLERLHERLKEKSMGLLLDIVPNHMSASTANPWWRDVLENGINSRYAAFFDIVWHPSAAVPNAENKILLPILGRRYSEALATREIRLAFGQEGFSIQYYDLQFPVGLSSYESILAECGGARAGRQISTVLKEIRSMERTSDAERQAAIKRSVNRKLWKLVNTSKEVCAAIDGCLAQINADKADDAPDLLDSLIEQQAYRLIHWRRAANDANYRRFFDISDLVGIRTELPEVFEAVHAKLLEWVSRGIVTGIRVDHVDGLFDPKSYLEHLQKRCGEAARTEGDGRFYVVVEKIVARNETLPPWFPVAGTSGYDWLVSTNRLLMDEKGVRRAIEIYDRFTSNRRSFEGMVYRRKKQVLATLFGGDLRMLGRQLIEFAGSDAQVRYCSSREIVQALIEISACLGVYRTYIYDLYVSDRDRQFIEDAVAKARTMNELDPAVYDFVRRVLLLENPPEAMAQSWLDLVMRWQQFTGPIMAKGVEDTTFYAYNALVSLNEVGGGVDTGGATFCEEAHRLNARHEADWPHTLNTTSTHDTKRAEDARARINVLTELGDEWETFLGRWSKWNAKLRSTVQGRPVPDPNEEIFIYQTLIGMWPLDKRETRSVRQRLAQFLTKAAREAKTYTSWIDPNTEHEAALIRFTNRILSRSSRFLPSFLKLHAATSFYGAVNSLAQVVLKITSPGVPDFYQGTELWDFSMVDPDNRRAVDFEHRKKILRRIRRREASEDPALRQELLREWSSGAIKLHVIQKALRFRGSRSSLFRDGAYIPLIARGELRDHVFAFARRAGSEWSITIVPRLPAGLVRPGTWPIGARVWHRTEIQMPDDAPVEWIEGFSGATVASRGREKKRISVADALASFPVAILFARSQKIKEARPGCVGRACDFDQYPNGR